MRVRPELIPPSIPDEELDHLNHVAEAILDAAHDIAADSSALIAQFNQQTNRNYSLDDFLIADDTIGLVEFVKHAVMPQPIRVADITDTELLDIIGFLQRGDGTAQEQDYWLEFLERNLPHPAIVNLIYWRSDLHTPDAILAAARAYKPILL